MDSNIMDMLYLKSNEELIAILSQNENSPDVIALVEDVLIERGVDIENIQKEASTFKRKKIGDEQISKYTILIYFYSALAILCLSSLVISLIPYFRFSLINYFQLVIFLVSAWQAIFSFIKKRKLNKVKNSIIESDGIYLDIILKLKGLIKNNKSQEIYSFILEHINHSNYSKFCEEYEGECYATLSDDLINGSKEYEQIRIKLQALIDLNILEKEYPHKMITNTIK